VTARSGAGLAAAVLALALAGTESAAQDVFAACEGDIGAYCSAVEPGHGRLMACLYAHEDKVSAPCDQAIGETADMIDLVFARLRHAAQQCGKDIREHCGDVAVGEGRVFACLHAERQALSPKCAEVVDAVEYPEN